MAWAALIPAAIGLAGQLSGQKAQKEQAERERKQQGIQTAYKQESKAHEGLQKGQQAALSNILNAYKSSLT